MNAVSNPDALQRQEVGRATSMRRGLSAWTLVCVLSLVACQSQGDGAGTGPTEAYDGIGEGEAIFLTGTEPFWGGEIDGGEARYTTPENQDGALFKVTRFAGNSGLAYTGQIEGEAFDLMITPGECSDGMSDRTYPFFATLKIGDEQRNGCAWTDRSSFTGDAMP